MKFIKKNATLFSILIALCTIFSFAQLTFNNFIGLKYLTNNILIYVILFSLYCFSYNIIQKTEQIKIKYPLIFSILFSLAFVLGQSLAVEFTAFRKINIINFICLLPIMFLISTYFFSNIENIKNKLANLNYSQKINNLFFKTNKKSFFACFIFILICHLPAFLAYFPGIFTYDVYFQANFFKSNELIEIHPLLHNLFIYLILLISFITKSKITGVLCYTLFQYAIMFSIFCYCIRILSKYNTNYYMKLFALLFFALHPINQVFSLSVIKDTLFSSMVLLFILQMIEMYQNKDYLTQNRNKIFIIVTIFLIFALRHNGFVAYIFFLPFLLFSLKKDIKKALIVFIFPILLFFGYGLIKTSLGIKPSPIATSIGIPLQQMGRVRKNITDLEENDIQTFRNLVSKYKEMSYFPLCSDNIRLIDQNLHSDFIEEAMKKPAPYIKLWFKWGFKYPKEYIDAFLMNNYSYWYPNVSYPSYSLHYFFYTVNRWEKINGIEIGQKELNPITKRLYNDLFLSKDFENYPIVSTFFSMGVNIWLNILAIFVLIYQKKKNLVLPLIFNLCLYTTLLFGPIVLLRYMYFSYLLTPLIFAFIFSDFYKKD